MAHGGASFEHTVANVYRREGWTTIRAYASLGIWDLMCFRKRGVTFEPPREYTEVLAVQVKGRKSDPFSDEEKATLKAWAESFGGRAVYAYGKYELHVVGKGKKGQPIYRRKKHRTVIREFL